MRIASDIVEEIESLSDDLGELEWARLAAIRTEVRALMDEVVRELLVLQFTYESRRDGGYSEDEVDLAATAGLDPAAQLAWLLTRADRCADIARFLSSQQTCAPGDAMRTKRRDLISARATSHGACKRAWPNGNR